MGQPTVVTIDRWSLKQVSLYVMHMYICMYVHMYIRRCGLRTYVHTMHMSMCIAIYVHAGNLS